MKKVALTVHQSGGEYFAARYFPPSGPGPIGREIFTVTKEPPDIKALEEDARRMARQKGIPFVVNLDRR